MEQARDCCRRHITHNKCRRRLAQRSAIVVHVQPPHYVEILRGLEADMAKQKAWYLQASTGLQQVPKKKYRVLGERVLRAVAAYGRADILSFLQSMAHLSHS